MPSTTTTSPATLTDQIRRVAELRRSGAALGNQLHQQKVAWEEANADLLVSVTKVKHQLAEEELRLRDMAVREFKATGQTKPGPGLSIRRSIDPMYDEAKAFAWAKEQGMALSLDRKGFEAIAKHADLPFVKLVETASATLATDLDAALATAELTQVAGTTSATATEGAES